MLTPLQRKKQEHFFKLIDFDGNQILEADDWIGIGKKLASVRGVAEGSQEHSDVMKAAHTVWKDLSEYIADGKATKEQWLKFVEEKIINAYQSTFDGYVGRTVKGLFDLMDEDKNGHIEQEEFTKFFACFGLSEEEAKKSFDRMDLDGNGTIEESELETAVFEFFRSDDINSPGNYLLGPIY